KWPAPEHPPLFPPNVAARARARQIMAWVRSDLLPLREERSAEYVFLPRDGGPLFGAWSIADTDLAMMLQRLVKTNEPLPDRLRAFAEREWLRPSVQAYTNAPRPAQHRPAAT